MLPIKKLYIDSRDRTPDSVSASNFRIDLPYVIQTPDNTVFFITDVSIPHIWTTIEAGVNDKLYVWITNTSLPASMAYYVINMTPGNYTAATLAIALQNSLNATVPETYLHAATQLVATTCSYPSTLRTVPWFFSATTTLQQRQPLRR